MSRRSVGAVALALVLMAGAAILVFGRAEHNTTSSPPFEREREQYFLLAADAHGAVVASSTSVRGVDRTGQQQWSMSDWPALYGACAPTCPSAVLSGDGRNLNSFMAPDPKPLVLGGGTAPAWLRQPTGGKAAVLSARFGGLLFATNDNGVASWRSNGDTLDHVHVSPGFVDWFPASDGSAGLSVVDSGEYRQTVWYATAGGWKMRPGVGRSDSGFGCVSRAAQLWVNDARQIQGVRQSPVDIKTDGAEPKLSACGFARRNLVTVLHRFSTQGASTTVRVLDVRSGEPLFERTLRGEYLLSTDVRSERFLLIGEREARIYHSSGRVLRTEPEVVAAKFVKDGEIVVVRPDGQVEWMR